MSIAIVQSKTHGNTSSATNATTFTSTSTVGNLIIVVTGFDQAGGIHVTGVTDSASNTYIQVSGAQAGPSNTNESYTDIWYCENAAAISGAITVTYSQPALHALVSIIEVSGAKNSSVLDAGSEIATSSSLPVIGPTITPTASGELLVCVAYTSSELLTGASGSWAPGNPDMTLNGYCWADYIDAPLTAQNCNFTPNSSVPEYASSAASFLAVPSGPSDAQKASMFLVL